MDPCLKRNYTYSYRDKDLCFETGYLGLKVNTSDLRNVKFGIFDDDNNDLSYLEVIPSCYEPKASCDDDVDVGSEIDACTRTDTRTRTCNDRMNTQLNNEELVIEINLLSDDDAADNDDADKTQYRLVTCNDKTRLWESGRICQHYDFKDLKFEKTGGSDTNDKDDNNNMILDNCNATLYIVVWPDSIAFTMELIFNANGNDKIEVKDAIQKLRGLNIQMKMKNWTMKQSFDTISKSNSNQTYQASLHCNINDNREKMNGKIHIDCSVKEPKQEMQTNFCNHLNSYVIAKNGPINRTFKGGYTDIRDYDVFHIQVRNETDEDVYVPVLLFVQPLANSTGVCPIICNMNFEPTGIPMQLSKNWHNKQMPNYGRFYSLLPVKANKSWECYVRLPYGFYGTLPAASHANLSLIGYGDDPGTRWEQLAIGCWGETCCMDLDMGCCKQTITDIRMLFTKGEDGKLWQWSNAGWGGDWLQVYNDKSERLMPFSWKSAYESHGPCLTCMHIGGSYQSSDGNQVELTSSVRTLRTDDYARTFTRLSYVFKKDLPTLKSHLFGLGSSSHINTPKVVYGNRDGLTEEINVEEDIERDAYFIERKELTGSPPWFIGFPDQEIRDKAKLGKGFRALVIRKFHASFSNVEYHNPSISLIGQHKHLNVDVNLKLVLSPPIGVESFQSGDNVDFEVELITLPKTAKDYYGPNEEFRSHLLKNEDSWRMIYREAIQNDLQVTISGGILKCKYPIIITVTDEDKVVVRTKGGVGGVPIKFEGLKSTDYVLNQLLESGEERFAPEVHGNDYWQTDFDAITQFSLTFNIALDQTKRPVTEWILRKQ